LHPKTYENEQTSERIERIDFGISVAANKN
jgi:hypothetical protein